MAAPPEKKEFTSMTMVLKEWSDGQSDQFSPVHRINGYPFRLRIHRGKIFCARQKRLIFDRYCSVFLICDKSLESELWMCTVTSKLLINATLSQWSSLGIVFCSWGKKEAGICSRYFDAGDKLHVTIATKEDGESWRPIEPYPTLEPFDGALVIGEEKIGVNKQSLAAQSPYFDRLFFGNFMEKNMTEISIGDVEYKEFDKIIKMVYGSGTDSECSLTAYNGLRVLELADRFELKTVMNRAIFFILSSSSFSRAQILLIAQDKNIPFLKKLCLHTCDIRELRNIQNSSKFADFSDELKAEIIKMIERGIDSRFRFR